MSKSNRNQGLDPETQYVEIYRNLATFEFPWDITQSLSFALFRTYAVPSIGNLLDRTGEFGRDTQKRYDDTTILLEVPLLEGLDSVKGKEAIRRINQMHKMYDIGNGDMVYTLATFVVVPKRWIDNYGWRRLTDDEVVASVRYYQALGRRMGIKEIPGTYEEFETLLDEYEAGHFGYDEGGRRVADKTMALMASFYPRPLAPAIDLFSRAMMEEPLLNAFGYRDPGPLVRRISAASLRLRARVVAWLPVRRKPRYAHDLPRIRTYPNGFDIERMGTFAHGCPVRHTDEPATWNGAPEPATH